MPPSDVAMAAPRRQSERKLETAAAAAAEKTTVAATAVVGKSCVEGLCGAICAGEKRKMSMAAAAAVSAGGTTGHSHTVTLQLSAAAGNSADLDGASGLSQAMRAAAMAGLWKQGRL